MGIPWRLLQACRALQTTKIRSLKTEQLLMPPGLALQGGPQEPGSREGRERREYEGSEGTLPKPVIEIPR